MDRQSTHGTRILAWLVVVTVHTGLFWLLTLQLSSEPDAADEPRLRLVWVQPTPAPRPAEPAPPPPVAPRPLQVAPAAPRRQPTPTLIEQPDPQTAPAAASSADLLQQGQGWARGPSQAGTDFTPNPLHSRRAQLPGGDRGDAFRMRQPMSPARVMQAVAGLFGDPGPPCPRVQARVQGLLTATSDKERALLEEELRRERQFCHP